MFKLKIKKVATDDGRLVPFGTFLSHRLDELLELQDQLRFRHDLYCEIFVQVNHIVGFVPMHDLRRTIEDLQSVVESIEVRLKDSKRQEREKERDVAFHQA